MEQKIEKLFELKDSITRNAERLEVLTNYMIDETELPKITTLAFISNELSSELLSFSTEMETILEH